jgi:hypothetical protein
MSRPAPTCDSCRYFIAFAGHCGNPTNATPIDPRDQGKPIDTIPTTPRDARPEWTCQLHEPSKP